MLVGLIRCSALARMLGVHAKTVEDWCTRSGLTMTRRPVLGLGRTSGSPGKSPWYLTTGQAATLIDLMLPKVVDRQANRRAREQARVEARRLEESTRNLHHESVGGTGSEAPKPNPAL
jgi:hypothetical protein